MHLIRIWTAAVLCVPAVLPQTVPIFEFHSGFWVNLHHYLLEQAMHASSTDDPPEWRRALEY